METCHRLPVRCNATNVSNKVIVKFANWKHAGLFCQKHLPWALQIFLNSILIINFMSSCPYVHIIVTYGDGAQLYKLCESGNGTKISDKKWCSAKIKYLENKKW